MRYLLFSFLLTLSQHILAQSTVAELDYDTNYVESLSDKVVIKNFVQRKSNELKLENLENGRELKYEPNGLSSIGASFNYKWLGVSFAVKSEDQSEVDTKGESSGIDFQMNMYMRKFAIDAYYVKYDGYFLANQEELLGQRPPMDESLVKSSIKVKTIGFNGLYIFNNKRFSYRAPFSQNEIQKKSAGSWLVGAFVAQNNIHSDKSLIPDEYKRDFNRESDISEGMFTKYGVKGGYGHTFVIWRMYISMSLTLGFAYEQSKIKINGSGHFRYREALGTKEQVKVAIGYQVPRFVVGFGIVQDHFSIVSKETEKVSVALGSFRIMTAYRFNAPGFLKKTVGSVRMPFSKKK